MEIQTSISLLNFTSWLVGGQADFFCQPKNTEDFNAALLWAHQQKQPITILGGGSNVLIHDAGVRGLVINNRKFSGIEVIEDPYKLKMTCLAGTGKSEVLKQFLKYKLAPALFLAGLPGDVGGGVVMNAGVSENFTPKEFGEIVEWIEVVDITDQGHLQTRQMYAEE
ncbi:MAG: FAD-binding protein, partial [Pseudobdellovibrionaceae bacterium]